VAPQPPAMTCAPAGSERGAGETAIGAVVVEHAAIAPNARAAAIDFTASDVHPPRRPGSDWWRRRELNPPPGRSHEVDSEPLPPKVPPKSYGGGLWESSSDGSSRGDG